MRHTLTFPFIDDALAADMRVPQLRDADALRTGGDAVCGIDHRSNCRAPLSAASHTRAIITGLQRRGYMSPLLQGSGPVIPCGVNVREGCAH
jgi:hypothetical protein